MKFMEIDDAGYVHHIRDCPVITMIPLVNQIKHSGADKQELKHPVTGKPVSFRGNQWLPPMPINDEDYARLQADGLCGVSARGTEWHYKYDTRKGTFTKVDVL